MSTGATERLTRLLAMVPFLAERQGIPLAEAASQLGVSERQLIKDLELLFLCGRPGHMPDDLIEARWDDGNVYLSNVDPIARPLRLAVDEALALMVGLRALADVPGLQDRAALDRATAKLKTAAGGVVRGSGQVAVSVPESPLPLEELRGALRDRRRVRLTYFVPARDESNERDVDPMRVLMVEGRWYLEGWCHRAEEMRLFRLDRIEALEVLDVPGEPPPQAAQRDVAEGLFRPSPEHLEVTLVLHPGATWMADYYPTEEVLAQPDGTLRVRLRVADDRWLRSLVLRLGGAAQIVDPVELADSVTERAREALAAYA